MWYLFGDASCVLVGCGGRVEALLHGHGHHGGADHEGGEGGRDDEGQLPPVDEAHQEAQQGARHREDEGRHLLADRVLHGKALVGHLARQLVRVVRVEPPDLLPQDRPEVVLADHHRLPLSRDHPRGHLHE